MSEQATAAATTTDTAAVDATTQAAAATTATSETSTTTTTADAGTQAAATQAGATEEGKAAETDTAAQGAPEKYELTAPEGFALEPETTQAFETVARELNLSNEQANKLIPLGAQLAQKIQDQQTEAHQQQVAKWAEEAKADKELGGEKFDASLATALKARDRFATPELKNLMDQTGLGNHPEMVRLFHRIGMAIADDTFVQAPSGSGSEKSLAERMYPSQSK